MEFRNYAPKELAKKLSIYVLRQQKNWVGVFQKLTFMLTTWHTARWNTIFSHVYLTCEVYHIKVLEISAQMLQYITFLSLKTIKMSSDFILNYLKKVVGGATTRIYQKQMLKP